MKTINVIGEVQTALFGITFHNRLTLNSNLVLRLWGIKQNEFIDTVQAVDVHGSGLKMPFYSIFRSGLTFLKVLDSFIFMIIPRPRCHLFCFIRPSLGVKLNVSKMFKKTTKATLTGKSLNKRFNEQNNSCARAL